MKTYPVLGQAVYVADKFNRLTQGVVVGRIFDGRKKQNKFQVKVQDRVLSLTLEEMFENDGS